jgi:citrate lyase subunit beta/citryl-CoA lyase
VDLLQVEPTSTPCKSGFGGQIAAANAAFGPSPQELAAAREIVAAWRDAQAAGRGVVVVNGRLVEQLHVVEAKRLLAMAEVITRNATAA